MAREKEWTMKAGGGGWTMCEAEERLGERG